MGVRLEWSIEGEKQLSRRLRGVSMATRHLKTPFTQAGRELTRTFKNDVFRTKGGAIEERWKRLSPVTVAQKARKGYRNPTHPLIGTGEMKKAFRFDAEDDYAIIYNTKDYFKYHQSSKPRDRVPRRVMMKLAEAQRKTVVRIFHKYLRRRMRKN